jgi:hypothetical protein
MGDRPTRAPRFRPADEPPPIQLTDDDIAILWHVYRHRLIDSEAIYSLFPNRSRQQLSRRLGAMFHARYLGRPPQQIEHFAAGGGSKPFVYALEREGARVLRDRFGVPVKIERWLQKNKEVQQRNIKHTLATTRFMVALETACRARGNVRLIPFDELLATYAPAQTKKLPYPDVIRAPIAWNGHSGGEGTRPDRIFGLEYRDRPAGKNRTFFYLEIDEGHETVEPGERQRKAPSFFRRSSILRKLVVYAFAHRAHMHEKHFGFGAAARILTVTTTRARIESMRETYRRHLMPEPMRIQPGLFLFTHQRALYDHQADLLALSWSNGIGNPVSIDGR